MFSMFGETPTTIYPRRARKPPYAAGMIMDNDRNMNKISPDMGRNRYAIRSKVLVSLLVVVVFSCGCTLAVLYFPVYLMSFGTTTTVFMGGVVVVLLIFLDWLTRRSGRQLVMRYQKKRDDFRKTLNSEKEKQLRAFRVEKKPQKTPTGIQPDGMIDRD